MAQPTNHQSSHRPSLGLYITGFVFSLVLTLLAYVLVQIHVNSDHATLSHAVLLPILGVLALTQFAVQLQFFLHLGAERGTRWNLLAFSFMIATVIILVGGSLWIMTNLNYHMTPTQVNTYLQSQDGL